MYGLFAALGGWCAGVLAEMFGARRIMMFGACWWIGIHLLFLGVAIPSGLYSLILGLYALRGIGYPLFIYSFVVLMAQYISPARLASATGFFWTCFSLGIGVFGAYLPSFIMPVFGEYKTFWFALPFSIVGTVMCFFFVPKNKNRQIARTEPQGTARRAGRGCHHPGHQSQGAHLRDHPHHQ